MNLKKDNKLQKIQINYDYYRPTKRFVGARERVEEVSLTSIRS